MYIKYLLYSFVLFISQILYGQHLKSLTVNSLAVLSIENDAGIKYSLDRPLVSFEVNGKVYNSNKDTPFTITFEYKSESLKGIVGTVQFKNNSMDTIKLSNVVPFGLNDNVAYITGLGDHRLSRTHLFLPHKIPVNVIVPDNAWELGYSAFKLGDNLNVFGLVRRDLTSLVKATRRRFETIVEPRGSVTYNFYSDFYNGEWQQGLSEVFQKRYLYDVKEFDNSMYEREDLQWIKKAYVMHLLMAWDKDFYDSNNGGYRLMSFLRKGKKIYGGDDVICIWPTWPTLGVDQRNQFDLYRDLPGGLSKIKEIADSARLLGAKFFIAYNPWDESTRSEGHLKGLADLIKATSADGVVLDTKGESSKELQEAADIVKGGVIMYSEGMAVPKDMEEIISGRVHNALYYPPLLNLNKLIRPDFAIFRVAEVFKEKIQREYATSFFNGYGTEINQFAPGHPEWEEEQYLYFGKTSRILRENNSVFVRPFTPLISTLQESVYVNKWIDKRKIIYTVFSIQPEGFHNNLFELDPSIEGHTVDLWKHENIEVKTENGKAYAFVNIDGYDKRYSGTNNEGEVSCVAQFKPFIEIETKEDKLQVKIVSPFDLLKIWKGNPAYDKEPFLVNVEKKSSIEIVLSNVLNDYEGKLVVQAFAQDELVDEHITFLKPGTPRLVSNTYKTKPQSKLSGDMVIIPPGKLKIQFTQGDEFIPYPKLHKDEIVEFNSFAMDKHPVTNSEFKKFIEVSKYKPSDTSNYLKHWMNGEINKGEEKFPVVYISYEDAKAYAMWANKRLPTELEWQYAAQTNAGNEWPWKQLKPVTRKETFVTETLTVKSIEGISSKNCNLGDGKLYPVGKYKAGVNPNGLFDLSGCVWQLTNDVYESGSYRYIIMKGGSYFKPSSSWWYVQGGPRELHYRQALLRVSQGFERNATVGFRCVKDID
jgi:formylglycine-generating enzyme required for sulfatase activity